MTAHFPDLLQELKKSGVVKPSFMSPTSPLNEILMNRRATFPIYSICATYLVLTWS